MKHTHIQIHTHMQGTRSTSFLKNSVKPNSIEDAMLTYIKAKKQMDQDRNGWHKNSKTEPQSMDCRIIEHTYIDGKPKHA